MAHAQHLEQEAPVEAALAVVAVVADVVGEVGVAGEGAGEDDAGAVTQGLGEAPARRDLLARPGVVVGAHQGDAGVAQGLEASRHGELGGDIVGADDVGIDAVVSGQIEVCLDAGEVNELLVPIDGVEGALTGLWVLVQADDPLRQQATAGGVVEVTDAVLAGEDRPEVLGVEDLGATRQAHAGARGDHADLRRARCTSGRGRAHGPGTEHSGGGRRGRGCCGWRLEGVRRGSRRRGGRRGRVRRRLDRRRQRRAQRVHQSGDGGLDGSGDAGGISPLQSGAHATFHQGSQRVMGQGHHSGRRGG